MSRIRTHLVRVVVGLPVMVAAMVAGGAVFYGGWLLIQALITGVDWTAVIITASLIALVAVVLAGASETGRDIIEWRQKRRERAEP